ncbi:hypothetical protein [Hyalangium sp.]|uniref:hypothetical protein n=1 Tax=Hyalangium sp. TaxID=2028555 RepID=UPI002D76C82F|nr:hypothetical protein [Hyalangium sp.]
MSLLSLAGGSAGAQTPASAPAKEAPPAAPYDARVISQTQLFRKVKPETEDIRLITPGHIVSVSRLDKEHTWKGETAPMAAVHPYAQSTYYMLSSHLRPVSPGEVVSDADAAAVLFQKVPDASRTWCQRFTGRLSLPASAGAGKAEALVYSAANDTACAGYLALVSGTGKAAKARALPRRGAIQSVTVHEVPGGGPPLLDVLEALSGPGLSGSRRTLLSLERGAARELLTVDLENNRLEKDTRQSVNSTMALNPSSNGFDIEVRRTELRVVLATGAETKGAESVKRYRYAGGKLTALPVTAPKP